MDEPININPANEGGAAFCRRVAADQALLQALLDAEIAARDPRGQQDFKRAGEVAACRDRLFPERYEACVQQADDENDLLD